MVKGHGKLVIVGAGETAELAYEYFTDTTDVEVVSFSAERRFVEEGELLGLPVVPLDELRDLYPPETHKVFVAISYTQLNRARTCLYEQVTENGYECSTLVHPTTFLGRDVKIGTNSLVLECNNIQRKVRVGNNTIIWAKNHIGHRSIIGDNCYLASGVIISGYCEIRENCFVGVNSSFNDRVTVAKDTVIGNGAIVTKSITEPGGVYVGNPARRLPRSSYEVFGIKKERE